MRLSGLCFLCCCVVGDSGFGALELLEFWGLFFRILGFWPRILKFEGVGF